MATTRRTMVPVAIRREAMEMDLADPATAAPVRRDTVAGRIGAVCPMDQGRVSMKYLTAPPWKTERSKPHNLISNCY